MSSCVPSGLVLCMHACTPTVARGHIGDGSWRSASGRDSAPQPTGCAAAGAARGPRDDQLLRPAALDGHPLAGEPVAGPRVPRDRVAGACHRRHVVALARAGRADAREERWPEPVGLPLLAALALLEAVVLEQPVELAGDGGQV